MKSHKAMTRVSPGQAGYNLVEVLIAMALLGTVLLSIISLFFLGQNNVYSGKQMTQALSAGTEVMEDFAAMTADDVYTNFGISFGTPATANTAGPTVIAGRSYSDFILRDTNTISGTTDPKGYLQKWKDLLPESKINAGKVSIILLPRIVKPVPPATVGPGVPPAIATTVDVAPILRIRVVVEWKERLRSRSFVLDTVKTKRI